MKNKKIDKVYKAINGIGQERIFSHFRPIIDIHPKWYHKIFLPLIKTREYNDGENWVRYKKLFGKIFVVDVSNNERYNSPYVINPKAFKGS
jgi:hypothetical protein